VYDPIPLHYLTAGQSAEIQQIVGQREQVRHLEELGMCSGCTVEMIQPGSPCIVRLGESKFCFRLGEALGVLVQPGAVA